MHLDCRPTDVNLPTLVRAMTGHGPCPRCAQRVVFASLPGPPVSHRLLQVLQGPPSRDLPPCPSRGLLQSSFRELCWLLGPPRAPGPLPPPPPGCLVLPRFTWSQLSSRSTWSSCGAPARPGLTRPTPPGGGGLLSARCQAVRLPQREPAEAARSMSPTCPQACRATCQSPGPLGIRTSPL